MPKMRAVIFNQHGSVNELVETYVDIPHLGADDVLIKIKACAVNHLDLWTLQGMPGVNIPLPHILGCDVAGIVVDAGKNARKWISSKPVVVCPGLRDEKSSYTLEDWDSLAPGYRILGFQVDGGFAEYVKVPSKNVVRANHRLSFEEWAAAPLVFLTAWHMLVTRAGLQKGEKVLIHAAGSGVGSASIQIAKYLGAEIFTTVGSDAKAKRARAIGAHEVINYEKKDFALEIKKLTHNRGVDVVVEHIGPATFQKSLLCLAKRGRLVTCGVTSGPLASVELRSLFFNQHSILGAYMGGFAEFKKVMRLMRHKKIKPVIDKVFPLREARRALERMQERGNFGKIVLVP